MSEVEVKVQHVRAGDVWEGREVVAVDPWPSHGVVWVAFAEGSMVRDHDTTLTVTRRAET